MADHPNGISRTLSKATYGSREPHRVAIVQDWGVGLEPLYDQYDATQLAFEEATESGLLDRPVELKVVEVEGLPYARATTVLQAVESVTGSPVPHSMGPRRPGDPAVLYATADRIQRDLGWQPVYRDLRTIVDTAWQWRRRHPGGYSGGGIARSGA